MLNDNESVALFRQYGKRLYNTALRITLSPDESDEIMQETLIRFITGSTTGVSDASKVWAWLRTTCVRLSIDWLRSRKRFVSLDDVDDEPIQNSDDSDLWDKLDGKALPMVLKAISELPDGYRTVLTLRLIEGYDYAEIAAELGISEAGVRSQFMRARKIVSERLRSMLVSEDF